MAAPSADICWAIGADVVLRTTDGVAWARTTSPPADRLIAVSATDANTAVVTASDGRRFATSDGGASWGRGS